jgi:ABC-type transporter Mla MlaB component
VDELARCWAAVAGTQHGGSVCVQLDGVAFIDAAGRALLRTMHEEGATLSASGPMTRAVLEEIRRERSNRDHGG